MEPKDKTIYRRGAEWGLPLGGIFAAMFFCMVLGMTWSGTDLLTLLLGAGALAITYVSLWQTHRDCHGLTAFSALWMQGITTYFCASVLAGLVGYVYMQWFNPGLLDQVCLTAADTYAKIDTPAAQQLATDLRKVVERNLMPSPINVVMAWMWAGVFGGSIISIIITAVVRLRKVPTVKELGR